MTTMIDKAVPGFDELYTQIGEGVGNFKVIKSLSIVRHNDEDAYDCVVVLVDNSRESTNIILRCRYISKIIANLVGTKRLNISGLQVFNIKSKGMEDQEWEISDYEDGNITILCREVSVSIK
jgi:hypothetical protein